MTSEEALKTKILGRLDLSREVEDVELQELIFCVLEEESAVEYIPLEEKARLGKELFNAFRKLDLLQELIEDDEITEVMINGVQNIFVEKHGRLYLTDRHFVSRDKLDDVIQQIVAGTNRLVNEASPIVDTRLADGSRVNVVLYPVALNGPVVTIRKFPKEQITMDRLVELEALSEEVAGVLKKLVVSGYNIFISGGTGSGKTTLLNIIGGIDSADSGYISINGEKTADMNEKALTNYRRRHLGYVFQMYNLIPNLNVKENIEVGAYLSDKSLDIDELLKTLGLYEHRHKLPNQLSGGQQQRTAIGRAIVKNPDILLCDEPTGALDYNTSKEILKLIEDVNQKYGNTVIMVTHNDAIKNMADRVIKLRDGQIRKDYTNEVKIPAQELDW